ncbi:putative bifunctional diguanylate cyclase/phosphodiesterase [Sphingomonas jatrophae]|uniref:EAL domain, c-di-GMP-specific phosphodiesterase class I (Or its enzymatically inactive variant) n=1 Tax=Sphingomonas jatrophae TaxID=1166337 RepID=A0A1I6JVS9_9SPHN|nr:GGDEF domain-containing phosphodiesterase [Sphingomonas jatrophae]SFR83089.1 EAL domain, c-di-GMP-specific phosphodiesterase class I (or its enzymatically inactive variant) [Sphingomonas jatrophae]
MDALVGEAERRRRWGMKARSPLVLLAAGAAALVLLAGLVAGAMALAGANSASASPWVDRAPGLLALVVAAAALALRVWTALRGRRSDPATGLPNAAALTADHPAFPGALAVARIADFARIAAVTGPADLAILVQRVAERLRLGSGGRAIYRIDEAALAWIVPDEAGDTADDRFAGLAAVLRAPIAVGGRAIDVSVSFGLAERGAADDAPGLIAAGLLAAQRAHAAGRRWERASADEREAIDWQLSLVGELDQAIASGALWVAYQPKLDIASGRITSAEALVRWQHPRRGNIPPDQFVPSVEAHGRAQAMTAHVLHTALADAASWRKIGRPIGVAVNVSATLLSDDRLVAEIGAALARWRIPADMLTLEVTESAAIASADAAIERLGELRQMGVRISIDDYGTGQSTMTYLKRFPATELKIDKSFIQNLATSRADLILVRSTIDLAHALGMCVVAEGVEDADCLAKLVELGCDTAQGWHIGRPMPGENLALMQAWQRAA